MWLSRSVRLSMALVIILSACIYTTGCFSSGDLEAQRDEVISAISAHRTSFDNYFIVYTIGIDLWNIEVSGGSVNSRVLRTQIAREEGFLADVSGKHRQVSASVTRFWGIAQTLEGNEGARASDIAWNLRVYDEEMWNAQNALIGRLSSLRQYLDMVDAGKKDAAEALSYLESANTLSLDAAGAIGRADAARIRAESG